MLKGYSWHMNVGHGQSIVFSVVKFESLYSYHSYRTCYDITADNLVKEKKQDTYLFLQHIPIAKTHVLYRVGRREAGGGGAEGRGGWDYQNTQLAEREIRQILCFSPLFCMVTETKLQGDMYKSLGSAFVSQT